MFVWSCSIAKWHNRWIIHSLHKMFSIFLVLQKIGVYQKTDFRLSRCKRREINGHIEIVSCFKCCKPSSKIFYCPFQGGTSFVDFFMCFCLVFVMPLYASVYMCLVVTCWERDGLLALVCGVLLWVCYVPIGILGDCIDSWSLHPYLLSLPDFFGRPNFMEYAYDHDILSYLAETIFKRSLCLAICSIDRNVCRY